MINVAKVSNSDAFSFSCSAYFTLVAVFDNVVNDRFVLLIETCMTAGKKSVAKWHNNTLRDAVGDAKRPEQALEDLLSGVFTMWTGLVNLLNDLLNGFNVVAAKGTVSNENLKLKRELIGTTVRRIAKHVKFAILEAGRQILRRECDITVAAEDIGKLSREEAEKSGLIYGS